MTQTDSLRDRTRRAVRAELLEVSQQLFAGRGYEEVTIDEIAHAAGMSRRSFFRYFASKEDLVLGKYERQGEKFAAALDSRPLDEPDWIALRRMFDDVVAYISDPASAQRAAEMDRVVSASPVLRAGYLERMQRAQELVVERLGNRGVRRGAPAPNELSRVVLVSAAFAALSAAHGYAQSYDVPLSIALDDAMSALQDALTR